MKSQDRVMSGQSRIRRACWFGFCLFVLSVGVFWAPSWVDAQTNVHSLRSSRKGIWAIRRSAKKLPLMRLVYRVRLGSPGAQRMTGRRIAASRESRAIPYLLGMRSMKEAQMRRGALLALAQLALPWGWEAALPSLRDPSPGVRLAAIEAVSHPQSKATIPLIRMVRQGSRLEARSALMALSKIGAPEALASLKAHRGRHAKSLGVEISLTRAALGDPAARRWWGQRIWRYAHLGRRLGMWPGRWSARLLGSGLYKKQTRLRVYAVKWLKLRLSRHRAEEFVKACRQRALTPGTCTRAQRYIRTLPPPIPPPPRPFFLMKPAEIATALRQLHQKYTTPTTRLKAIGARLLGTPYRLDALGEGPKGRFDRDPIFSFHQLDCVTFLEEIIGLHRHANLSRAIRYTQRLRYTDGKVQYACRNHLPLAQWIPALIRLRVARDITREIGKRATRTLYKHITHRSYAVRSAQRFVRRMGRHRLITGTFQMPYLRLRDALNRLSRIPEGSLISMLRPPKASSPGQVFHQGITVKLGGKMHIRHATKVWGGIVDTPLRWYLQSLTRYRRPVLGIHLLHLQDNGSHTKTSLSSKRNPLDITTP